MTLISSIPLSTHRLNSEQQAAYEQLRAFITGNSRDEMFCLRGYAGTGKTFLISHLVAEIMRESETMGPLGRKNIALTAPTNKAVQVLRESSGLTGVTFKTIHSLLGLKEVISESGHIDFKKGNNENDVDIRSFDILIIDEVSMLNDELFYEIKRYNNDVRIILMGDPAQIPPVGKTDCEPFLNPQAHGIIEIQLTQIMRQADGSSIVANSFRIRDNIAQEGLEIEPGADLQLLSARADRETIRQKFIETFKSVDIADKTKVIAWSNQKVNEYNRYIRSLLFGPEVAKLMPGERLMMGGPYQVERVYESAQSKYRTDADMLTTNQEIEVVDFTIETQELKKKFALKVYSVRIKYTDQELKSRQGRITILHEHSQNRFDSELARIKEMALTSPSMNRRTVWKSYYDLLRSVADVSYAYAITAHKSQGSTYDTTFIDLGNICCNERTIERNRILYTALTRARKHVTLIK